MKYNIGSTVKLKDDLEVGKRYGEYYFNEEMKNLIGKKLVIDAIHHLNGDNYIHYHIKDVSSRYSFTDEMLEDFYKDKPNFKIEVREIKWKDIPGYEGKYQVSNTGEVKSLNYRGSGKTKLLRQSTDKNGYKRVGLFKNGKEKKYRVHRLVAIVFLPNPNDLSQVNHKDENPSNNNVNNLEWCTIAYNNTYGTRNERASESKRGKHRSEETKKKISESIKGGNNPNAKSILMYDKEGNFIKRFDCVADANEYFGKARNFGSISDCLTGKQKTAYGYVFKYA